MIFLSFFSTANDYCCQPQSSHPSYNFVGSWGASYLLIIGYLYYWSAHSFSDLVNWSWALDLYLNHYYKRQFSLTTGRPLGPALQLISWKLLPLLMLDISSTKQLLLSYKLFYLCWSDHQDFVALLSQPVNLKKCIFPYWMVIWVLKVSEKYQRLVIFYINHHRSDFHSCVQVYANNLYFFKKLEIIVWSVKTSFYRVHMLAQEEYSYELK